MKKLILLLALTLSFSLISCGGKDTKPTTTQDVPAQKQASKNTEKVSEGGEVPGWFFNPPKEKGFFFFAGVGSGKSKQGGKTAAMGDVFSQVVYMVNASVSSNTTMEKFTEENEKDIKKNSSLYQKVNAKGDAIIEDFEVVEQFTKKEVEDGNEREVFYVLAKVPKAEIEKSRERILKEREQRKKNTMGVFAVSVFPDKSIEEIDTIKSEIENLYKTMGYNVKTVNINFTADAFASTGATVDFLKAKGKDLKKALICVIKTTNLRKDKTNGYDSVSILGDMTIREIDLTTGEIASTVTISGKGASMRKNNPEEDAFRKLIQDLTAKFLGGDEKSSTDDYM